MPVLTLCKLRISGCRSIVKQSFTTGQSKPTPLDVHFTISFHVAFTVEDSHHLIFKILLDSIVEVTIILQVTIGIIFSYISTCCILTCLILSFLNSVLGHSSHCSIWAIEYQSFLIFPKVCARTRIVRAS